MATDQSPAKVITLYVRVFLEYCHKDRVVIKYYKNVRRFHYVSQHLLASAVTKLWIVVIIDHIAYSRQQGDEGRSALDDRMLVWLINFLIYRGQIKLKA